MNGPWHEANSSCTPCALPESFMYLKRCPWRGDIHWLCSPLFSFSMGLFLGGVSKLFHFWDGNRRWISVCVNRGSRWDSPRREGLKATSSSWRRRKNSKVFTNAEDDAKSRGLLTLTVEDKIIHSLTGTAAVYYHHAVSIVYGAAHCACKASH